MDILTINADYDLHSMNSLYNEETKDSLLVAAMFATIQGEMPFAGRPAIFLRLGGCNRGAKTTVACNWCDTMFRVDASNWISVEETAEYLIKLADEATMKYPLLVISGGEPMLQATNLIRLMDNEFICERFSGIQVETNGDLFGTTGVRKLLDFVQETNEDFLEALDEEVANGLGNERFINFVISPKRSVKTLKQASFLDMVAAEPGFYLRLVVSSDPESPYYNIPPIFLEEWPLDCFYVSPVTVYKQKPNDAEITDITTDIDLTATRANLRRAMDLANVNGLRVSLQAHAYIGIA